MVQCYRSAVTDNDRLVLGTKKIWNHLRRERSLAQQQAVTQSEFFQRFASPKQHDITTTSNCIYFFSSFFFPFKKEKKRTNVRVCV